MSNIVNREKVEALIREQVTTEIMQQAPTQSVFMELARKLPNMTSKQTRIRVLDLLPMAYWVNGDTGYKQTSEQAWDNVYLSAEELAVIVPIPEAVLDDAEFDIMGEITPRVIEAIGKRVDAAVIFGTNKPEGWPLGIVQRARQAGNNVAATTDLYEDIMGENGVISKIEQYGYMHTGAIAATSMRGKLRGLRDDIGRPLFTPSVQGKSQYDLDGEPIRFPRSGAYDPAIAQMVVGDWKQAVYAIRQDITTKIPTESVIQDPATGNIVYNLAQQDMIALRVVFRMGWALPNPVTGLDSDRTGCPFAYLEPSSPQTTQTITFTVTDGESAVAGAYVSIGGARLKTDANGQCVFNLPAGSYTAKIKAKGFTASEVGVTVASAAVTQSITLTAAS